jgi:catechol 2,3-dioxygenase-like lactoylglutathione lyase family enzyme
MRLDHMAFRVSDRKATANFLSAILKYKIGTEFDIVFDDGSKTECIAMTPKEKMDNVPSIEAGGHRHVAPEIFVSDGEPDSIVGKWVNERGGTGGIHHIAYQVFNIDRIVKEWKEAGVEFLSEEVIDCPDDDLRQIFTKPLDYLGGMIIELIERGDKGFCQNSVKSLMESTKETK